MESDSKNVDKTGLNVDTQNLQKQPLWVIKGKKRGREDFLFL